MNSADQMAFAGQREKFGRICALIDNASTICVCAHTNPDGDAIGSGLALSKLISQHWPEKSVTNLLADNNGCVPRLYTFLAGSDTYVHASDYTENPDLFIVLDLSSKPRLNDAQAVLERAKTVAIMDHHPTNEPFGDVALIRPDAAATGVIVAEFALFIGADITPDIANNLFCAIVTDTGRFQYQNADSEAFECASMLVDAGAKPSLISLNVYQSFRLNYLHLESVVMGRIVTFAKGRIAYSYSTLSDLERTGTKTDECDGLIDVVRSVEGSEVALFLKEVPGGTVRGNLRSKGDLDISGVARAFGGGGHKAAAGFTSEVGIDETLSTVLPLLCDLLEPLEGGSCEAQCQESSEASSSTNKEC